MRLNYELYKTLKKHLSLKLVYFCVSKKQENYYFASRRNYASGHITVFQQVFRAPLVHPELFSIDSSHAVVV